MRVYFLSHSAAPNHLGGSELSLLSLIDGWSERDPAFVPTLVGPTSRGALVAEARRRGYETFNVPFEGWALFSDPGGRPEAALRTRRDFASTVRLIQRMKDDRPDLVVTNTVVSPWGAYAAAALGIPHVWFVREFADEERGFRFPMGRDAVLGDVGRLSTLVVANSDALRTALGSHIPAEKLVTSYPPVELARVRSLADQPVPTTPFTLPAADLTVTVVGRITRTKGQWRVIEAIGRLRARGVRVAVCFVGVTVEADADVLLARRARRLGVADAITFVGEQVNPFPFVRGADVGVTPSDIEAFGRTTFEYMTLGRPVIATRGGGSDELVVDGATGYLVDADDIDGLASRLEALAGDPALRAAMGSAGRERAESLMTSSDVDRIVALLAEAATRDVPRLPATVVAWLDVPELFGPSRESALRALVRVRHLGRRLAGAARHPWATIRRRWLRARRLSDRAGRPLAGPQID
jgi:glycosyltransferase involved in cell wall biosynthesis